MGYLIIILVLIYIPVHIFITFFVVRSFKKYTPEKLSISRLGTKKSPKAQLFNVSSFIIGVLIFLLGFSLSKYLDTSSLLLVSKSISGIGFILILLSLLPYDRFPQAHDGVAVILMILIILLSISFATEVYKVGLLPSYFIVISAVSMFCCLAFIYEIIKGYPKMRFPKATWLWEWGLYFSQFALLFATCWHIIAKS